MKRAVHVGRPTNGVPVVALAAILSALSWSSTASADSPARNALDEQELKLLAKQFPRSLELLEQGEAALRSGKLEEALRLFEGSRNGARTVALPARRSCQVLALLGRTSQAKFTCSLALDARGSAMDARASVAAWLSGPALLTSAELERVATLADRSRRLGAQKPWGHAAMCDIARRLGDRGLLKDCVTRLSALAPGHYETVRATAAAATPLWPRRLAWGLLVVLCLGTAIRSLRHRPGSRVSVPGAAKAGAAGFAAFLAFAQWTLPAHGETNASPGDPHDLGAPSRPLGELSSKFKVDQKDPQKSIPSTEARNKDPVQFGYWLMDLAAMADSALRKQDYDRAAKYFEAMVVAVPDRPIGFSKLCQAYLGQNRKDKAIAPCKRALALDGANLEDHLRYARLVISKQGELSPQEIGDLDAQVKHLLGSNQPAQGHRIACELAARLDDEARLEACTAGLAAAAPNDLGTVSFQWALALKQDDPDRAHALLLRARELGMTQEGLDKMQAGAEAMERPWRKALRHWRHVTASLLVVFAAVVLILTRRRLGSQKSELVGAP